MSSFETFDWNTEFQSNRWKEFQRNTDVPYGMDEQDILYRLKLKYFKKFIVTYFTRCKCNSPL